MAKRFSRLNYALSTLRSPNSTAPTPDAPAGTILKNYQDVASKKTVLSYPRAETSKPQSLLKVSVLPFFFGGAAGTEVIVPQSKRADDETVVDTIQGACNQVAVDVEAHQELRSFRPAQAVVFVESGAPTEETSQITGVKYQKRSGESYTFPYGASATETAEGNVRKDILAAVSALGTASVSFTSERV